MVKYKGRPKLGSLKYCCMLIVCCDWIQSEETGCQCAYMAQMSGRPDAHCQRVKLPLHWGADESPSGNGTDFLPMKSLERSSPLLDSAFLRASRSTCGRQLSMWCMTIQCLVSLAHEIYSPSYTGTENSKEHCWQMFYMDLILRLCRVGASNCWNEWIYLQHSLNSICPSHTQSPLSASWKAEHRPSDKLVTTFWARHCTAPEHPPHAFHVWVLQTYWPSLGSYECPVIWSLICLGPKKNHAEARHLFYSLLPVNLHQGPWLLEEANLQPLLAEDKPSIQLILEPSRGSQRLSRLQKAANFSN